MTNDYDDRFATCEQTHALLRIYSGELSPHEVSKRLAVEPTQVNVRGATRLSLTTGRTRTAPLNAWFLSSEGRVESKDLRRHLDWLLDLIEPAAAALNRLKREPDLRMDILCSWWSVDGDGGPILSPAQLRRMGQLELSCGFEIMFFRDRE